MEYWPIKLLLSCISAHEIFIERDIVLLLNSPLKHLLNGISAHSIGTSNLASITGV